MIWLLFIVGALVTLAGLGSYSHQTNIRAAWQSFAVISLGAALMLAALLIGGSNG